MYSNEDLERFYFQYQTEGVPNGISIVSSQPLFCGPPYSIIAGIPAKVIKRRFTDEQILKHESNICFCSRNFFNNLFYFKMRESGRIISIDILKVFAVFMVLNSHMEKCYHPYEFFSTGGAIGDALFFFCSGFTLFLGRTERFDNWYKKRIARIYPTVFVATFITSFFFNDNMNMKDIIISGGGWFVSCMMIYYLILYFIKKYCMDYMKWVFLFFAIIVLLWYYFLFDNLEHVSMYGNNYFKWCFFFSFMLQGAIMGKNNEKYSYDKWVVVKLLTCTLLWYSFFITQKYNNLIIDFQYLSLFPLLGITYYFYLFCCKANWITIYKRKYIGQILFIIGSICLEAYLIQGSLFTDKLNFLFPLNVPIIMILIFIVSYAVNFLSSFFSQTFKSEPYNWNKMLLRKTKS